MFNIKYLIKKIPFIVNLKRKIFDKELEAYGSTNLNLFDTFPSYYPNSSGKYTPKAKLTIQTINNLFYSLNFLHKELNYKSNLENFNNINRQEFIEKNLECPKDYATKNNAINISKDLEKLFNKYGSDKSRNHIYHFFYAIMLKNRYEIRNIVEVGIGTNNIDTVSNMTSKGVPGASLRAFRDFCPNAIVIGADFDKRILFQEDRIKTFFVDQTKIESINSLNNKLSQDIDLLIDDGLHSPDANINTLSMGISKVKKGGWIVIEDIVLEAFNIWKFLKTILETNNFKCYLFKSGDPKRFVFAAMKK